ncbi:conserved hypothetical protein [Lebetimonas natsushimae]|uniref:DUF72 domain-containing protein n=1 Tax=Lebetimonas natsushimae TaxID=1936991 RepID=A0A292YI24_9BACT|nr:DUF72 domain-containing protein [Lebetimonas natsushimae]GAX88254.1 conserved hypothetical protein [Lebetimonas natsushimae]
MLYTGTSGYFYRNWQGEFYPPELPTSKWLEYYVNFFNSLELNSTFYKFPKTSTIKNWKYKIKNNFKLSIKANKIITHNSKLKNIDKLKEFLEIVSVLDEKLGVVLFQLPPSLKYEKDLFVNFINSLNKNLKYAIECRNKSWYKYEVYEIMKQNNICLVWHDFNQDFIFEYTANFNYIRFHGFSGKYIGSYPDNVLQTIKSKLLNEAYVYFNNTDDNSAFKDAKRFMEL